MHQTTAILALALSPLLTFGANLKLSGCDISKVSIPGLPVTFTPPPAPPAFVAIAIGVQNYTCNAPGTYVNVGAVAELFDISCFVKTSIFSEIPNLAIAIWTAAPASITAQEIIGKLELSPSPEILGQHYYVENPLTGIGIDPKWDFTSGAFAGNPDAFVVASKVTGESAPTGSQDIDWVDLKGIQGSLAQEIYRTDTRLGQPPASCIPGSLPISVKYAAKYWLVGGTIKK